MSQRTNLKLVSLDGGGVRGFSQLILLKELMDQLRAKKYPDEPDKVMVPCEHFDMIGGSGTGGLLAIMFTRLRMSVDDVIAEFSTIVDQVYKPQCTPSKRTQNLRACIEDMFIRKGWRLESQLEEAWQDNHCAGFALVLSSVELRHKVAFRSYRSPRGLPSGISVIDAMLASCASTPKFAAVTIEPGFRGQTYVAADLGANNPTAEVLSEAYALYGGDSKVNSLLSLGSGHPGVITLPPKNDERLMEKVFQAVLSDSEVAAEEMQLRMKNVGIYFRLSVRQGMLRNGMVCDDELGWITTQTTNYLENEEALSILCTYIQTSEDGNGWIIVDKLVLTGAPRPQYKVAPMRAKHYIHREEPWKRLIKAVINKDKRQTVIILAGMAGCGKTQLVAEVLRVYDPGPNAHFQHTFFIDGSSESSIKSDLIAHVQLVIARDGSRIGFEDTINFLQNPDNCRWLIIFDNVDDIQINIRPFLPNCNHGVIVITTRNQLLRKMASAPSHHIELDTMSAEEAIEVILRCAGHESPSDEVKRAAAPIASKLGYLPVALTQAGCYMSDTGCSCEEYLELLSSHLAELMEEPSGDLQNYSTYAAFDLTYDRLPPNIRDLVHILSFFHFADFPMAVIPYAAKRSFNQNEFQFADCSRDTEAVQILKETFLSRGEWSNLTLLNIIRTLQNYSIASFTSTKFTQLLRIHPLMREWAFDRIPTSRRSVFQAAGCRLLVCCTEAKQLHPYFPPHNNAIMSRSASIEFSLNELAAFGKLLRINGQFRLANGIWLRIYGILRERAGADELEVAAAALELATTYVDENLVHRETLEREAVSIRTRAVGAKHHDTLKAMDNLAGTLSRQGRHEEARILKEEVLNELQAQLPSDHPDLLKAAESLAWSHRRQHRFSEAETIQLQIVEEKTARLGETHLETVEAMSGLAWTYHDQSRYSEAEGLRVKVLESRKSQLGNTHKDTLIAMHNLASTYHLQGRDSEAELLRVSVVEATRAQLGDTDPHTLVAMYNLASTYHEQSRHSEAESLQMQVLEGMELRLGEAHPNTLLAMGSLAATYYSQTRYAESATLLVRALELHEGRNTRQVAKCLYNLSWTYYHLGQLTEAMDMALKAEQMEKNLLGVEHPGYKVIIELVNFLRRSSRVVKKRGPHAIKYYYS